MERIIQITSGRGPAECAWVVAQVIKKIWDEASDEKIQVEMLFREAGQENGTVVSALISLKGENASDFAESWIGTIQWIGQSQFRKLHKRKNWFIGIFEVTKLEKSMLLDKDIQYQAMRSSGAGGQHVNKVSSAIRATHIPTGIAAVAMDSRSQHQNKKLAKERLMQKVEASFLDRIKQECENQWMNQMQVERENPKRVFVGTDFKRQKEIKNKSKTERQRSKKMIRDEITR